MQCQLQKAMHKNHAHNLCSCQKQPRYVLHVLEGQSSVYSTSPGGESLWAVHIAQLYKKKERVISLRALNGTRELRLPYLLEQCHKRALRI